MEPDQEELAKAVEHLSGLIAQLDGAIHPLVETQRLQAEELNSVTMTLRGTNGGEINPGLVREFQRLRSQVQALETARVPNTQLDWKAWSFILGAASAISASVAAIVQALSGG